MNFKDSSNKLIIHPIFHKHAEVSSDTVCMCMQRYTCPRFTPEIHVIFYKACSHPRWHILGSL